MSPKLRKRRPRPNFNCLCIILRFMLPFLEVRVLDINSERFGVPIDALMENAGEAVAEVIEPTPEKSCNTIQKPMTMSAGSDTTAYPMTTCTDERGNSSR